MCKPFSYVELAARFGGAAAQVEKGGAPRRIGELVVDPGTCEVRLLAAVTTRRAAPRANWRGRSAERRHARADVVVAGARSLLTHCPAQRLSLTLRLAVLELPPASVAATLSLATTFLPRLRARLARRRPWRLVFNFRVAVAPAPISALDRCRAQRHRDVDAEREGVEAEPLVGADQAEPDTFLAFLSESDRDELLTLGGRRRFARGEHLMH